MNIANHIWFIITSFVIFIMLFLIWFFGFNDLRNNLDASNLDDAVRTAMYYSEDNSQRAQRGTFGIDVPKFKAIFNKIHIKTFNGQTVPDGDYTVDYLPDSSSKLVNINHSGDSNYMALRGVKVGVNYDAKNGVKAASQNEMQGKDDNGHEVDTKTMSQEHPHLFTATQLVQTYGRRSRFDTENDVSR